MAYNDPENVDNSIAILNQGRATDYWELLQGIIDERIDGIDVEMNNPELIKLPATEYKVQLEILKGRKRDLLFLKDLPDNAILELQEPDQTREETDPFEKEDELE